MCERNDAADLRSMLRRAGVEFTIQHDSPPVVEHVHHNVTYKEVLNPELFPSVTTITLVETKVAFVFENLLLKSVRIGG